MFDISSGYLAAGCYKEYCPALVDVASAVSAGRTPIVRDGVRAGPALDAYLPMKEPVRLSFRIINFNPDHTSSTAHTLMSTSPIGSATSRIVSSVISVLTPEDFFGHETHITPLGTMFVR